MNCLLVVSNRLRSTVEAGEQDHEVREGLGTLVSASRLLFRA